MALPNVHRWGGLLAVALVWFCGCGCLWAQGPTQVIEVLNTDVLSIEKNGDELLRKLIGNVQFRQDTVLMYCDSAYHFPDENRIEAMSRVRIVLSPQRTLSADRITYDGNTKVAELYNNIRLVDSATVLTTNRMTYYRADGYMRYFGGGTLMNDSNVLVSQQGYYYTRTREALFRYDVVLTSPDYRLLADSLRYNTRTETAKFLCPTQITGKDSVYMTCADGWYATHRKELYLHGLPYFRDSTYEVAADTLYYNDSTGLGRAVCNVFMTTRDTTLAIAGDYAVFDKTAKTSLITENPYLIQRDPKDTLLVFADTLFVVEDTANNNRKLRAYHNVRITLRDARALADSVVYDRQDSVFRLYKGPILWSAANQLTGDTIYMYLKNKEIDSLVVLSNAFAASEEAPQHFNQLKGRRMQAKFRDRKLLWLLIVGNSESLYFAKEDSAFVGVNHSFSSSLRAYFKDNKPSKVYFLAQPTATYSPYFMIAADPTKLEGFAWRVAEQPIRYTVDLRPFGVLNERGSAPAPAPNDEETTAGE